MNRSETLGRGAKQHALLLGQRSIDEGARAGLHYSNYVALPLLLPRGGPHATSKRASPAGRHAQWGSTAMLRGVSERPLKQKPRTAATGSNGGTVRSAHLGVDVLKLVHHPGWRCHE